jgi:hypothetical protein
LQTKSIIFFAHILSICYQMALLVGLPERALVDESGLFPSRHHPSWFPMLIYHLGDEKSFI